MKIKNILSLIIFIIFFVACSSTQETVKKEDSQKDNPEIYVFDAVANADSAQTEKADSTDKNEEMKVPSEDTIHSQKYYVQVGAFTTRERADTFVKENQSKIDYKMNISFSNEVNLFVVQLPPFSTREEAEKVRDNLWLTDTFKDAFIITK